MKPFPILILLVVLSASGLNAQQPINVYEDSISFTKHKYPGVVVTIPESSLESVQKRWEKAIESGTKSKAVYENGEWTIFGANLKKISPTPVNLYSKMVSQDSLVKMMVSIELKDDVFVEKGSYEAELEQMKTYLKQFAKDEYTEVADGQLKEEDKKLKDLNKELSSYQKDESDLEKSIRDAEKTIKEEQENLVVLNNEESTLSAEIIKQNQDLNQLSDGPAKEGMAKSIKELDKQKRKLMNDIESGNKKISKAQDNIRDANSEIPKKQELQKELNEKVAAQEAVVRKYEDKLKTISAY
jgi:hypothetical protein